MVVPNFRLQVQNRATIEFDQMTFEFEHIPRWTIEFDQMKCRIRPDEEQAQEHCKTIEFDHWRNRIRLIDRSTKVMKCRFQQRLPLDCNRLKCSHRIRSEDNRIRPDHRIRPMDRRIRLMRAGAKMQNSGN